MPAYMVITREKTRDESKLEDYKRLVPASFQKYPAKHLAIRGRQEVLEGPKNEYQAASHYRFLGGDYRFILTEGVAAK
jgi:hypothetical protein